MAQHHNHADTGHGHNHDGHEHDTLGHSRHARHEEASSSVSSARPGFSLLRLSAFQRLAGAFTLSAFLWCGVWWALQ